MEKTPRQECDEAPQLCSCFAPTSNATPSAFEHYFR